MGKKVYGVIYMAINIFNWKVYIGQTVRDPLKRWKQHCYDAKKEYEFFCETGVKPCAFHNAIWNYGGMDSFIWVVIDKAYSCEELNEKEMYWIAYYNTFNGDGYNETEGGGGIKGRKHTEETRKIMSEKAKVRKGENTSMYGKKRPKEFSELMSKIHKGKKVSDSSKLKNKEAHLNPIKSIDVNGNIEVFSSAKEAYRCTGIQNAHITKVLQGKRKTAGGRIWCKITMEEYLEATQLNEAM